ncbi:MAG: ABC transporter permease [Alphaproteobacteria bacterium]|nr:ABC transporter permease [Alphaproteobacteria bacterium]
MSDEVLPEPRWRIHLRRARRHTGFMAGAIIVAIAAFMAIFAELLMPHDPYLQDLSKRLLPPIWDAAGTWTHPLGTDHLGRDYLSRLIIGSRVSLIVGGLATLIAGLIGATLGLLGGYYGGRIDAVIMYVVAARLSLPGILTALALLAVIKGSLVSVVAVLGFLLWDRFALVVRSATQQVRAQDYIAGAVAVGTTETRILWKHVLPNILNPLIVVATLEMAAAILAEASLSFLGLGVPPPTASWGLLVSEGRNFMFFKPYLIALPGALIILLVIAINALGDGLRDLASPVDSGES